MHVLVVGAGAFGTWTARWLLRRGASVTLVDQYGAGNSLASSGDESRVTRSAHGADAHYPQWQRRALEQWLELDRSLVVRTGVVWLAHVEDGFEAHSLRTLAGLGIPAERLEPGALRDRWPQLRTDDVGWGMFEPEAGVLMARRAVAATARAVAEEGGEVLTARAGLDQEGIVVEVDGGAVGFDAVIFAAGPWLPKLLGSVPGMELAVPRQEVIYLATPPGDARFDAGSLPTWVEYDAAFYGLPSIEGRGAKIAPDWPGPLVDPDTQERRLSDERVAVTRDYLRRRIPDLAERPVAEGRVCQYELTPDTHFLIDRIPALAHLNAWIVGGGSGHGFKHAPVIGEYVSGLVLGVDVSDLAPPDDRFALGTRVSGAGLRTAAIAPSE
jgi:sarcosine oxidase